jgi:hypothetical protein
MRVFVGAIAGMGVAVLLFANPLAAHDGSDFYWSSTEATLALIESDWAADRRVRSASCRGIGDHRTDDIGRVTFKHFRCALRNRTYQLVAHATMHTVAPEQFTITNLTNRLRACRPRA